MPQELQPQMQVGIRVTVPLGKKKLYAALVQNIHNQAPAYATKEVLSVIDEQPLVNAQQLLMWTWIADYYMCTLGEVMKAALPAALKMESETKIILGDIPDEGLDWDSDQELIVNVLQNKSPISIDELAGMLPKKNLLRSLQQLLQTNVVQVEERLQNTYKPKMQTLIALNSSRAHNEEEVNALFALFKRSAQQEKLLLAYLAMAMPVDYEQPLWVEQKNLLDKAQVKPSALKASIKKGIFVQQQQAQDLTKMRDTSQNTLPALSPAQQQALNEIEHCLATKNVALLHGVTSSGKTEIYIHLIQQALQEGKQVLFLLPEIALTTQLIQRLQKVFGESVGVYHSKFSDAQRAATYHSLLNNKTQLIVGVRSSIFLPYSRLGLVIVDEEHETTYKQYDPAPRYHARDVAIVMAVQAKAKVVLGSATPAIETFYNAQQGKYGYIPLTQRYGEAVLPLIRMLNVSDLRRKKNGGLFSPLLIQEIEERLARKEQIILFQNRRGFSPYVECKDCGFVPQCEHCNVSLTYHKYTGNLVCHYCGFSIPMPHSCMACGSSELSTQGFGTEKIEEELRIIFPETVVERMDLDTTRSRTAYHRIIADFESRRTQILVGTQMVTKGLDFDNVTLVGVLNADTMLSFPDFRSAERSFQLIQQVAGRAGRRSTQGLVLVQTRTPFHPVLQQVQSNDYLAMYHQQLDERRKFHYPPFSRLIRITLKHRQPNTLQDAAAMLAQGLQPLFGERLLGPEVPLINRIQNLYLINFLLKADIHTSLQQVKSLLRQQFDRLQQLPNFKSVVIVVDVDAY